MQIICNNYRCEAPLAERPWPGFKVRSYERNVRSEFLVFTVHRNYFQAAGSEIARMATRAASHIEDGTASKVVGPAHDPRRRSFDHGIQGNRLSVIERARAGRAAR